MNFNRSAKFCPVIAILAITTIATAQTETKNELWSQLLSEVRPYQENLKTFAVEYDESRWYAQSRTVPDRPELMKKALEEMAAIEKLMTGKYASVVPPKSYLDREIMEHPECWLEIAKARGKIAAKIVRRTLGTKADSEVKFIKDIAAAISTHEGWGLTETGLKIVMGKRAEVRSQITGGMDKIIEAAGSSGEGELLPGWDAECDKLVAEAKRLAPIIRGYTNHTNESISSRIKAGWAKNYKDRTILKIGTAKSGWTVVKNSLGVPLYRSMGVGVQYKVPGFTYVIEQTISIREDYSGGKYIYRPTSQLSDYRILAAKK